MSHRSTKGLPESKRRGASHGRLTNEATSGSTGQDWTDATPPLTCMFVHHTTPAGCSCTPLQGGGRGFEPRSAHSRSVRRDAPAAGAHVGLSVKMEPVSRQPGGPELFSILDSLVWTAEVVVDRPRGSPHPRIPGAIYPLDYGYLDGTCGGDGDGIDVFVGTAAGPGVSGILVTADPVKRDAEVKVLLCCSADEVTAAHRFVHDVLGIGGLLVRRE